jgi:hypothetical protein
MSSYELLELCEYMPDEGRLKTAMRDGDPSDLQQAIMQTANETAVLRAGMVAQSDGSQWGSRMFVPQRKIDEMVRDAQDTEEMLENVKSVMRRSSKREEG